MPNLFLVMIGGAAGAGLRYGVGRWAAQALGAAFPWGTLIVNLGGSLAIGLLAALFLDQGGTDRPAWLLMATGGLGGFTTFSAFSLELLNLLQRGEAGPAFLYAAASVLGGLACAAAGFGLARAAL